MPDPGSRTSTGFEPEKEIPISSPAPERTESLPDREALLGHLDPARRKIYETVRQLLDELEEAAPWKDLYYPPQDTAGLIEMELSLLGAIEAMPAKLSALTQGPAPAELDEAARQTLDDAEFFFSGIHENVRQDIAKLKSKVKALSLTADSIALTPEERAFTCEIGADLKGKYASSLMGAAASLIAGEVWNGVEIEPILFPEKEEEFERNALLVETLSAVIEDITNLLEEVPLADLVAQWQQEQRIDRYALTPLYSFLGKLGNLMKEKSRRALYSGDYHQIQKREGMLSTRINELNMLHNMTWGIVPSTVDSPYPLMIQKATELAAVLDVNMLKKIIGEKYVKDLRATVTTERDQQAQGRGLPGGGPQKPNTMRQSLPENLHSLIPLLYDDDLQNFLGFLLGAVLKRASLKLKKRPPEAAAEEAPPAPPVAGGEVLSPIDLPEVPEPVVEPEVEPAPTATMATDNSVAEVLEFLEELESRRPYVAMEAEAEPEDADSAFGYQSAELAAPIEPAAPETAAGVAASEPATPESAASDPLLPDKLDSLAQLQDLLNALLSRSNPHRKSFELVHRLLKQRRSLPKAMLESMQPYLYDMMNMLIPQLNNMDHVSDISAEHAAHLIEYCTFLCDRNLTPAQLKNEVPTTMERVIRLLDGLNATTSTLIKDLNEKLDGFYYS